MTRKSSCSFMAQDALSQDLHRGYSRGELDDTYNNNFLNTVQALGQIKLFQPTGVTINFHDPMKYHMRII